MKWVVIRQSVVKIFPLKFVIYLYVHLDWKQIIFSEIDTQEGKIYRIDTQKGKIFQNISKVSKELNHIKNYSLK